MAHVLKIVIVVWVAGWGFLFVTCPFVACRIFRQEATPGRLRTMRRLGAVELVLVAAGGIIATAYRLISN
jgi:hypothetical protein